MRTAHNPQRNRWFEIFDFTPSITPSGVNSNWALLNAEERIESFLSREEQHFCQE